MLTANFILLFAGLIVTACLYAFNAFFRARIAALILFLSGWTVFVAGFIGTAIHNDMPLWAWPIWAGFVVGYFFAIKSEYTLWQNSQSK
jgi:hypothetical protein